MLKVYNLALIEFGIGMVELCKNRHKTLYMSKNKVKCPLAWTTSRGSTFYIFKLYRSIFHKQIILLSTNTILMHVIKHLIHTEDIA